MTTPLSLPETRSDEDGPLVSVIIPTYEDSEHVGAALRSLAVQTYSNIEVVLIDSSGVGWLESLAGETDWIRYSFQQPTGLSTARNRGIDLAQGEYIGFLDADDEWLPEKLDRQLPLLESGVDVAYSDAYIKEGNARRRLSSLSINDIKTHHIDFLYEGGVPILTVVARRTCFETERFDESLPAVEDRHLIARLFYEYTPGRVAEPLVVYTRRTDSMSSDADLMYEAEIAVLESVIGRYGELEPHREPLLQNARYKYGKRLLRTGRKQAARRELYELIGDGYHDPRVLALSLATFFPIGGRRSLRWLERVQERLS